MGVSLRFWEMGRGRLQLFKKEIGICSSEERANLQNCLLGAYR